MPQSIPCANYPCQNYARKLGDLCDECQRRVDAEARLAEKRRWMSDGFEKWYDNKRKGYDGKEGGGR
jgi:hypothetical protein